MPGLPTHLVLELNVGTVDTHKIRKSGNGGYIIAAERETQISHSELHFASTIIPFIEKIYAR